jgi:hypothetical protein
MSQPQQPELRRSDRGDVTREGRRQTREDEEADRRAGRRERTGPVPRDNRPGHHPDEEQDQP